MTETHSGYSTDRIQWVPGLQGPQPQPEIVYVNGVKYRRVRECPDCPLVKTKPATKPDSPPHNCGSCYHWRLNALCDGSRLPGSRCMLMTTDGSAPMAFLHSIPEAGDTVYLITDRNFGCRMWAPKE